MNFFDVNLKIILDSRGQETLEAELKSDKFLAMASVPAGKSTGVHEAFVLEPKLALEKFQEIKPRILSASASGRIESQKDFDNFLISLDGTENKSNLGGNLILALSLAFARLKAKSEGLELFQYINEIFQISNSPFPLFSRLDGQELRRAGGFQIPTPIFNVINGGAHSGFAKTQINADDKQMNVDNISVNPRRYQRKSASLEFQEFQIIPEVKDFGMALGLGQEFYRKLKEFLEKKFGKENIFLGDEEGFSAPFKNNEEAIEILAELITKYNYPLRIGLDVAASQFYQRPTTNDQRQGFYLMGGKKYSADELKDFYLRLIESYNILSIEDPFYEESFEDFAELNADLYGLRRINTDKNISINQSNQHKSVLVVADDLTTTNPERLKTAINKKSGNAILIKPNQIGTLTETLKVVRVAYKNNWQAVVSHRSGETMDDFIADLAVGINAWGIKAGAPAKPERMAKYQRLLKIFNSIEVEPR